jgi:hypothetical protein
MARGPDGRMLPEGVADSSLEGEDGIFAASLERIVDQALVRHPAGGRFMYGIHQDLPPGVAELLSKRYRSVGWREVAIRPGATGAHILLLTP